MGTDETDLVKAAIEPLVKPIPDPQDKYLLSGLGLNFVAACRKPGAR